MKRILVPSDFSKLAETALDVAAAISRKTGAEIELLHVIESPHQQDYPLVEEADSVKATDAYVEKSIEMARKKITAIIDLVKYVGIRFNPKIKTGNSPKHLSEILVKEKIDLIVMGTEGASGYFKGVFNKTKTEDTVMNANCMVLSVKEGIKDFKIKKLVFATDFQDDAPQFIEKLKTLQDLFDFKIYILYVNSLLGEKKQTEDLLNKKEIFIKKHNLKNCEFVALEDFTEYTGITSYADEIDADVIALTTHQKKGFWHWVGGLSEDLVNYAEKPVLTFKADENT